MNIKLLEKEEKFYTAKYDRAFKEVFLKEENEELLLSVLKESLNTKIAKIRQRNIELNSGNIFVRRKYLDILLETDQGLIRIEINSSVEDYLHPRNLAFQCDNYAHYTLVGENYTEDVQIIQINLTYKMQDEELVRRYFIQDETGKKYAQNFQIIEWNMNKLMKFWYDKNEEIIAKYKHLIMLDLPKEELEELSKKDREVEKYMKEIERVNQDPRFREYMSKEEDQKKIYNTQMSKAYNEGISEGISKGISVGEKEKSIEIAKKLLNKLPINEIVKATGLSKEEIESL